MQFVWMMDQSAALDVEVLEMGNQANARPAFGFHLVEVFEAGKVSSSIGSSSFGSLLADGVSSTNVIDTGNLHGLGALLGMCEESKHGKKCNNQN
jgi:hypothetical protein